MIYGVKQNAALYDGDYVVQIENSIYVGKLKPGYPRTQNDDPVEEQPIWQIERIEMSEGTIPAYNENIQDYEDIAIETITRMYPNGNEDYRFKMSDFLTYNYEYRH